MSDAAYNPTDEQWMRYALALAAKGQGFVEPNPMVGCVILRDDQPIAEGRHERFGGPHAERMAITAAGDSVDLSGTTWYVTLEPCCHSGKTPPCTDAVIAARPRRVVVATKDPFPEVAGRGIEKMRGAGIDVSVGVCESEAKQLNAAYFKRVTMRRPWVIAKWAMTLDGKIATRTGDSKWISGETSRARVHALRGRVDAIVTGMGTVMSDDPLLTARPKGQRVAKRIVFDSGANLSLSSKLVNSIDKAPVIVIVDSDAPADRIENLRSVGCEIIHVGKEQGRAVINRVLDHCYETGMTNIMLEGGGGIVSSFFEADAIDEYHIYLASKVVGGLAATTPVSGIGLEKISDSPTLQPLQVEAIDGDLFISTRRRV